jgi:hypothetical protein
MSATIICSRAGRSGGRSSPLKLPRDGRGSDGGTDAREGLGRASRALESGDDAGRLGDGSRTETLAAPRQGSMSDRTFIPGS